MFDKYEFALCLTHDVDRPYKTFQVPYYAVKERNPTHLKSLLTSEHPYWQFEEIMELEDELGVRSSFYFLNEKKLIRDKRPRDWAKPKNWKLFTGRYNITDERIVDVIQTLDEGGWEVGLHGSYESYRDVDRLKDEKKQLEEVLGSKIIGGRQHYLNYDKPETWKLHNSIGLKYDASLGSNSQYGFQYGTEPIRPLDDGFLVFPLTVMEEPLMQSNSDLETVKNEVDRLILEAVQSEAVMTVLWHPRMFNQQEFPGYRETYIYLIKQAKEANAWIGSPGDYCSEILNVV